MNIILIIYISLAIVLFLGFLGLLFIISGKSILMDWKRIIKRTGCDIFIANNNRSMSHYFLVPQDDKFNIEGKTYITNPEKTMNLSDLDKLNVIDSITRSKQRIQENIKTLQKKIIWLTKSKESIKDPETINIYDSEIELLNNKIKTLTKKVESRLKNYFFNKRPAFFYIEGDAVPKDFHEYLTEMDGIIIDNLVARSLTKPPLKLDEAKKTMDLIKLLILASIAITAINIIIGFKNGTSIIAICEKVGCI